MPSVNVTSYAMFGWYPWEDYPFLKWNEGRMYLMEKGDGGESWIIVEETGHNAITYERVANKYII